MTDKFQPDTKMVPVPLIRARSDAIIERPQDQLGYLDRNPDSARQQIGFTPYLRSADEEVRRSWAPVTAMTRHLLTQSGFLAYGVELSCAWTVGGDGLQPNINPKIEALGWTAEYAHNWARRVEEYFNDWCHDPLSCDAQGRKKFGAIQNAALKSYLATGDILGVLSWSETGSRMFKSSVNLIDPTRLWTPPVWHSKGVHVHDGIEFDDRGRAIAYHIRPLPGFVETLRVPTYSGSGKQLLAHAFDSEVGAVRGISPLAAAIQAAAQAQNVGDAAVLAAHIAAMVVGVVTSDLPSDNVARSIGGPDANPLSAMMESRVNWHETLKSKNAHLQLGHGAKIAHLSTGERFDLLAGKVGFSDYEKMIRLGLAEAARALGLSPEHLTGIKDQATYSSLKVASVEARSIIDRRRKVLIEPFCEWALTSVVEELIADGRVPFPVGRYSSKLEAFRAQKAWVLRTEWTGPAIEEPDALKAARASAERLNSGLTTLSEEIAATGRDPETVFKKRAADEATLKKLGISVPWSTDSLAKKLEKGSSK